MGISPQSVEEEKRDVYLCYCKKDKEFAQRVCNELRNKDITVWFDESEILLGQSKIEKKAEGLKSSLFLVVLSRNALEDPSVMSEIRARLSLWENNEKRQDTIVPIRFGLSDKKDAIPPYLIDYSSISIPKTQKQEGGRQDQALNKLVNAIYARLHPSNILSVVKPEPYFFGNPNGVSPADFIEVEGLIQAVTEGIKNKQSLSVVGLLGMGKTSLLEFLQSEKYKVYFNNNSDIKPQFIYHDFNVGRCNEPNEIMPKLAEAISASLPVGKRFDISDYDKAYDGIKNAIKPGFLWVLLLDNFDSLIKYIEDDSARHVFDDLYILRKTHNISFIIASCRSLWSKSDNGPEFFKLDEHPLGLWNEDTAEKLMKKGDTRPEKIGGFNDYDRKFLFRLTAYHPFLLQYGCRHLLDACRKIGKESAAEQDYEQYERNLIDIFAESSYMQMTKRIYYDYWERQISAEDQNWIYRCCDALSKNSELKRQELIALSYGSDPNVDRAKLKRLGLVLGLPGISSLVIVVIPIGLRLFLRDIGKISYIYS